MKKGSVIIDLLGRKLKVESFQFISGPDYSGPVDFNNHSLTKDRNTGQHLLLARLENNKWEAIQHNLELKLYVRYKLTFLAYDPSKDMRKSWKKC